MRGEINRYEASGQFNQRQFFIGFNSRFSRTFQLNVNYSLSKTTNDTDGQGSALFPMNSYDASGEFGRAGFDIRHRFALFGTINLPWWKIVLNPLVFANSGLGFNITTGQDRNLDRQFNERPSFAAANANCAAVNIRCTRFGNFNQKPLPGETIIPRNFGQAPGFFVASLRISRTFTFGTINRGNAAAPARPAATGPAPAGAPAVPSEKRFNLNASLNFQNILNRVNLGVPVGNLASPDFGESLGLASMFGGFGGPAGGSAGAGNRRIYAQLRLNF